MTILILHGIEGHAGIHWQGWLGEQLFKDGHRVIMPTLPGADHPDREAWIMAVRDLIKDEDLGDLVMVAHSLGAVTALDLMEEVKIKAFISIAGFCRDYGAVLTGYFLKARKIDFGKVNANLGKTFVIYSDNDPYVPQFALKALAESLNVKPEIIPGSGHFNTEAGYITFPRLLEIIQRKI